ncbi:MAG: hypothetical protein JWO71_255 [Candidatus Acidoferrum typicum]|nr:hypothetical protein [Candidatus Acidoferrum typicum]
MSDLDFEFCADPGIKPQLPGDILRWSRCSKRFNTAMRVGSPIEKSKGEKEAALFKHKWYNSKA